LMDFFVVLRTDAAAWNLMANRWNKLYNLVCPHTRGFGMRLLDRRVKFVVLPMLFGCTAEGKGSSLASELDRACAELVDDAVGPAIDEGLFVVHGESIDELRDFEATVQHYMWTHGIPNAGLAFVSGDNRLVMTRSYDNHCGGETDSSGLLANTPETSQPTSRFRVGSISKSITATAIVTASEEPGALLNLDDLIINHIALEPAADFDGDDRVDIREAEVDDITIDHLLRHRGGWNCREPEDPIYVDNPVKDDFAVQAAYARVGRDISLPITIEDIIGYGSGLPLAYSPGTTKNYCGFGYLLLGEVLAAATGTSTASAVEELVLSKLGEHTIRPGRTLRAETGPDELMYHHHSDSTARSVMAEGDLSPYPYGGAFNLENRVGTGGWVASPLDVVRLGWAFTHGNLVADPETVVSRSMGWGEDFRRAGATGHTGSLEGTHAILLCYSLTDPDPVVAGGCWSVLFNKSPPRDDEHGIEPRDVLAEVPVGLTSLGSGEDYW
jgi:CubicO group peptidase (beta-lactamase class C family)